MVQKLQEQLNVLSLTYTDLRREVNMLKECCRAIRVSNSSYIPAIVDSFEKDEIETWTRTLPRARVTRWGGMISTPDSCIQESVRIALIFSKCPSHVVTKLMQNSHERCWPPGLSTLEIRQMNRRTYDNYICRKIPSRQAVVVMSCDNPHITSDLLLDPGLVMIFAHGIE